MKLLLSVLLVITTMLTVPWEAFADAQTIDFSSIMGWIYRNDWAAIDVPALDDTYEGGLGIPDVEEFELLSLILADPAFPRHEEIHAAFNTNVGLCRAAMNPMALGLTISPIETGPGARQPVPNTEPQEYYGADGLMSAYVLLGEWNFYLDFLDWMPFEASIPASHEGYFLIPDLSMCGDIDGDGVSNANEYWAASPHSFAHAINPAVAVAGCAWNVWACLGEPESNARFWYMPSTQRVYYMPSVPLTWAEATNYTIAYPCLVEVPVQLCTIRNQEENSFIHLNITKERSVWIGCTDAGRDIGHAAPNPEDWYWLSDPTQSPMTYTNWFTDRPNGVNGAKDVAIMDPYAWRDVSEFTGDPPEPSRYFGVFELGATYPDEDANGAPDAFEDKDGDLLPDGFVAPENEGEGEGEEGEGEDEGLPPGCFCRC
ncbi:MAG: C-type lectin domain-containing protein [Candidatus Hydrogenedentes bacterium]|nr:C-type lectin domain-containing protein [Candidatus Hydrogenedentota bacterium]